MCGLNRRSQTPAGSIRWTYNRTQEFALLESSLLTLVLLLWAPDFESPWAGVEEIRHNNMKRTLCLGEELTLESEKKGIPFDGDTT